MSTNIFLTGGQRYYIEALQSEGAGGDNLAVRWQLPDATIEEPLSATSVAGTRLIPCQNTNSLPGIFLQPTNTSVPERLDAVVGVEQLRKICAGQDPGHAVRVSRMPWRSAISRRMTS